MADDIDIEEHDVLDNPAIKNIFPDISVIKKEIQKYYEDGSENNQDSNTEFENNLFLIHSESNHGVKVTEIVKKNPEYITPVKMIFGAKENRTESQSNPLPNKTKKVTHQEIKSDTNYTQLKNKPKPKCFSNENPENIPLERNGFGYKENYAECNASPCLANENKKTFGNKIILGSKPAKKLKDNKENSSKNVKLREVKIILKDIHNDLENSKKFCKKCFILFSKQNDLNLHNKKMHLLKKTNENNFTETRTKNAKVVHNNDYKCKICGVMFSSSGNLNRHLRNVHYEQMIGGTSKTEISKTIKKGKEMQQKANTSNACFHCKDLFSTQQELIEHLYNVLQASTLKCKKCSEKISSQEQLKSHICKTKESINMKKMETESNDRTDLNTDNIMNENKGVFQVSKKIFLYRCLICSYFFKLSETLLLHMQKMHGNSEICEVKKALFDPKCKYCTSEYNDHKKYNAHIYKCHKQEYTKKNKIEVIDKVKQNTKSDANSDESVLTKNTDSDFDKIEDTKQRNNDTHNTDKCVKNKVIVKSILFKCSKCDIHFLSATTAMMHLEHIEMLINWKCSFCQLIFKKEDEILHQHQHSANTKFTVYDLSPSSNVLYKCPNCAIHFAEEKYFHHYEVCGLETANSMYCKICDILIDSDSVNNHKDKHQTDNLKFIDFTVIEPDMNKLNNDKIQTSDRRQLRRKTNSEVGDDLNVDIKKPKLDPDILRLTYCNTCKCFINKKYRPDVHLESRCKHMVKYVCDSCGLILTNKAINTHRALHRRKKDLKLQDFQFDDLRSSKLICPPIPEYPKCDICEVHFINKVGAKYHSCSESEFSTCHICQIKFSAPAYKLHMPFHNYSKRNTNSNNKIETETTVSEPVQTIHNTTVLQKVNENPEMVSDLEATSNIKDDLSYIIFSCQKCYTTVDTYDKLIEHCQSHFIHNKEQIPKITCLICNLAFEGEYYDVHRKLHTDKKSKKNPFKVVTCDISFYSRDYETWIKHVFGTLTTDQRDRILKKSIYRHETRIKMEITQNGPAHLTLYKCNRCRNFVDSSILFNHTLTACVVTRRHPCSFCGIPFLSINCRNKHEKLHKRRNIGVKSYRIVLFNKDSDKSLNDLLLSEFRNQYTLHQCRNCNGVVNVGDIKNHKCNNKDLKQCLECGLLLHKLEYGPHVFRHKECAKFNKKNLKVILIGDKNNDVVNNELTPSFEGIMYDYTFYKCMKCHVCVKKHEETLEHSCLNASAKIKCMKCDQYFSSRPAKHHQKLHEGDPDIRQENLTIVPFNYPSKKSKPDNSFIDIDEKEITSASDSDTTETNSILKKTPKEKVIKIKIYKCKECGLHFLEETDIASHIGRCSLRIRMTKQNCSKCNLLFTPTVLFKHLLAHHGGKGQKYRYDIVEKSKNIFSTIYKCSKCNLNFISKEGAEQHFDLCKGEGDKGKECDICKLKFSESCLILHQEGCYNLSKYIINDVKEENIILHQCYAEKSHMDTQNIKDIEELTNQSITKDKHENIVIMPNNHKTSLLGKTNDEVLSSTQELEMQHQSKTLDDVISRCCGWFIY